MGRSCREMINIVLARWTGAFSVMHHVPAISLSSAVIISGGADTVSYLCAQRLMNVSDTLQFPLRHWSRYTREAGAIRNWLITADNFGPKICDASLVLDLHVCK